MDEEFLQLYVNRLTSRINELTQENLLLKAHLDNANAKLQETAAEMPGSPQAEVKKEKK